jgi:hypothetical protein
MSVKHTDSSAAVLGATAGALGAANTSDVEVMLPASTELKI